MQRFTRLAPRHSLAKALLSPASYNGKTGLIYRVPLATRIKAYPFEMTIKGGKGSITLADQVKCLHWHARAAQPKGRAGAVELEDLRARLKALVG